MESNIFSPWLDATFESSLNREDLDYPRVALQAAQMLSVEEVQAVANLPREDTRVSVGSRNLLELAKHSVLVATLVWDVGLSQSLKAWDNPMQMASEVTALTIRAMLGINSTLDDMKRALAQRYLGHYAWYLRPTDRYAWGLAMEAIHDIDSVDLLQHGQIGMATRFRHLLLQAQIWLEEGAWTATKTAELRRWAELAFLGMAKPSDKAIEIVHAEVSWVEEQISIQESMRVTVNMADELGLDLDRAAAYADVTGDGMRSEAFPGRY